MSTNDPPIATDSIDRLFDLAEKYERLVWYARKRPLGHPMWDGVPHEIVTCAFNTMAQVEEHYPDEVERLRSVERGDWEDGFNSGMLAGIRLVLGLLSDDPRKRAHAEASFPELNT